MSDANKDQHEPSMEEILASIRRIISEDGEGAGGVAPAASGEDDVLVLTDEVDGDGEPMRAAELAVSEPPSSREPEIEREPVRAALENDSNEPRIQLSEPEPANGESAEPPAETPGETTRRLISDTTAAASLAALSELVSRTHREPDIHSMPLGNANRTLEDIARELLRPILKNWLDENLPELVERIVREEIGRLALDAQRR